MPYELHNATCTAPGRLAVFPSLSATRKALAAIVRDERRKYGNRINKLHNRHQALNTFNLLNRNAARYVIG